MSSAAAAWTTITETVWARTSCSSRPIRARSSRAARCASARRRASHARPSAPQLQASSAAANHSATPVQWPVASETVPYATTAPASAHSETRASRSQANVLSTISETPGPIAGKNTELIAPATSTTPVTAAGRTGIHHIAAAWTSASPTATARATGTDAVTGTGRTSG